MAQLPDDLVKMIHEDGYLKGYRDALDECAELADDYEHTWDVRAAILRLKEKV